jgi:hypothetical protein
MNTPPDLDRLLALTVRLMEGLVADVEARLGGPTSYTPEQVEGYMGLRQVGMFLSEALPAADLASLQRTLDTPLNGLLGLSQMLIMDQALAIEDRRDLENIKYTAALIGGMFNALAETSLLGVKLHLFGPILPHVISAGGNHSAAILNAFAEVQQAGEPVRVTVKDTAERVPELVIRFSENADPMHIPLLASPGEEG